MSYYISTNDFHDDDITKITEIYNICLEEERNTNSIEIQYTLEQVEEFLYKNIKTIKTIYFQIDELSPEIKDLYIKFLLDKRCILESINFRGIDPIIEILENAPPTFTNLNIVGCAVTINDAVNDYLVANKNIKKIYIEAFEIYGFKNCDYFIENGILEFHQVADIDSDS
jgi:hypothetical protein